MQVMTKLAQGILWLEPLILALIVFAFWYPTPTRTDWLWLLLLLLPVYAARVMVHRRLFTRTPLDVWFAAFLILGTLNISLAPYTRGLDMLARPLLGMALAYTLIESARTAGHLRGPLQVFTVLALLVGILAVGSTQWNPKSDLLDPVIAVLPALEGFPGAEGGFNGNEIAGALAWLTPLMAALMVFRWQQRDLRWDVTLAFVLLYGALFLGQSRAAIAGTLLALLLMIPFLLKQTRWRLFALAGVGLLVAGQAVVSVHFAQRELQRIESQPPAAVDAPPPQTRDENNLEGRLQIWSSALAILRDYPLTGVGLSMYRDNRVRADYPVPLMEGRILPHAHNEPLQVGADMGLPGLIVFMGLYAAAGYMLWAGWRRGDALLRAVCVGTAGGLLAHFVYGLADAVTLWDRFAFVFWMLLGLAAAQYVLARSLSETGHQNAR